MKFTIKIEKMHNGNITVTSNNKYKKKEYGTSVTTSDDDVELLLVSTARAIGRFYRKHGG